MPRIRLDTESLKRLETRPEVLGGETVFKGTRLPAAHIGKMLADGASTQDMLEDFPALTPDDLRFAELYYRARRRAESPHRKNFDAAAPSR